MKYYYGPSWMEVQLDAIEKNTRSVKAYVHRQKEATKVLGVVKADGYGHGAVEVARVMAASGIDYLGVATVYEGLELRKAGIEAPILVFTYTPSNFYAIAIRRNLTLTIYTEDMANDLADVGVMIGQTPQVHLKLDVGMTRLGFPMDDRSIEAIDAIHQLPLDIEGIYGHFPLADSEDKTETIAQGEAFKLYLKRLETRGHTYSIRHLSNSAAMMALEDYYFDMVRAGGILYGHFCLGHYMDQSPIGVEQAMSIRSVLSNVNHVKADTGVSYGWLYKTKEDAVIGTLPIGYADGISRRNTNKAEFLLRGQRVKQVGLICMDQMMIDMTVVEEGAIGDIVTLLGRDGQENITLEERAKSAGIGKAELFASIGRRLPKVYKQGEEVVKVQNYLWSD
jgi:alanine racemase